MGDIKESTETVTQNTDPVKNITIRWPVDLWLEVTMHTKRNNSSIQEFVTETVRMRLEGGESKAA